MKLHYGLTENGIILQKEVNLDTIIKEVTPQEIIYDEETSKFGVIMNRLVGWNVPEYVIAWFDSEDDDITCTYGMTYPTAYDETEYSPDWYNMEGYSRPNERRTGKVREVYKKLKRYFELAIV